MNNKEMAISFLRLASSGNVREAYEYVHPQFRHHNPYFPGDRASLLAGMEENAATLQEWGVLNIAPHADRERNLNNLPPCVLSKMNGALPHPGGGEWAN